jgi:aryl-alcohol dehydrogenase-like predicted oxidoreductase
LAYSPLQRGLLTGKITRDYSFGDGDTRPDTPHFRSSNVTRINRFLEEIRPIAEAKGATLTQLVIQWTLQQPGITVALVGARNETQVDENVGALNLELSADELELISGKLNGLELDLK